MGLLDMFMGNDNALSAKEMADDLLKDSKFSILSLATAATEASHPDVRTLLSQKLLSAIDQHYRLADLATRNDWYLPHASPEEQLMHDLAAQPPENPAAAEQIKGLQ